MARFRDVPGRAGARTKETAGIAANTEHRINERIRAREVRLVDDEGNQLGIKPLPEAQALARDRDLDLVEVAPTANPPVCRIMDYGKFKFDEAQRAKESRRKSSGHGIKEMKYRPKIGVGDFDTKTRKVAQFIQEGHKVKLTIMFRGREVFHPELGKRILDRVADAVVDIAKVEAAPKLDGRNMIMVLAPGRGKLSQPEAEAPGTPEAAGSPDAEAGSAEAVTVEAGTSEAVPTQAAETTKES